MLSHGFWFLTCDALATYRLSTLLVRDGITEPLRRFISKRAYHGDLTLRSRPWQWLSELVNCVHCTSVWFGAIVVALTRFDPSAWQYGAMALALSATAGFLGDR